MQVCRRFFKNKFIQFLFISQAIITRVGGVFVMLQRTCAKDCMVACTEKGFGIRIRDCTSCCTKEPDCGSSELVKKKWQWAKKSVSKERGKSHKNSAKNNRDTKYGIFFVCFTIVVRNKTFSRKQQWNNTCVWIIHLLKYLLVNYNSIRELKNSDLFKPRKIRKMANVSFGKMFATFFENVNVLIRISHFFWYDQQTDRCDLNFKTLLTLIYNSMLNTWNFVWKFNIIFNSQAKFRYRLIDNLLSIFFNLVNGDSLIP